MSSADVIRFLLDEHMPAAILEGLRRWKIDATSIDELRRKGTKDPQIVSLASADRRIIVTRDSDFIRLSQQGVPHSGIVFVTTMSVGQVIDALALIHGVMTFSEFADHIEYASQLV